MSSLSQALHLDYLPSSHSAFQDHAAHNTGWPVCLGPRAQGDWVGSGRVTLRHVSPIPPLDPYVRLSPHTAHERGTFTGNFHFANSTEHSPWSACAFVGYLCTVAPPSPSGPSPSVLVLVYPAFLGSDYYALFDCLEGFGVSLGSRLPTVHPPSHPFQALPCSKHRTQSRML
jgi:hypothetical protein